ncbi:MAG: DUF86 domain-containing protein [SAR202 cluster bacterium]|nr:DUF86 domain-containing protein [SAR202 cluster bacterium]
MRRDAGAYLWDVREAIDAILAFTHGKTGSDFENDLLLRSAVERQFEIVGEALNSISRIDPNLAARIPGLRHIVAFRNILIHGYAVIDNGRVWRVVEENLPGLRQVVATLLENESGSGSRA